MHLWFFTVRLIFNSLFFSLSSRVTFKNVNKFLWYDRFFRFAMFIVVVVCLLVLRSFFLFCIPLVMRNPGSFPIRILPKTISKLNEISFANCGQRHKYLWQEEKANKMLNFLCLCGGCCCSFWNYSLFGKFGLAVAKPFRNRKQLKFMCAHIVLFFYNFYSAI